MPLPVGVTRLGSFRGAKGEKGDTGTIASAGATSVPADQSASVTMSGSQSARHAQFTIPRGLPGLNAVENDEAFATYLSAEDSQTRAAIAGPLAARDRFRSLDVWDEFKVDGSGGKSWHAETYTAWIAGINARLGAAAERQVLGTDSSGNTIYVYTAGALGAPQVLLVGGTHPVESVSQHAAMRYFTEFALSKHPELAGLRNKLRISWVPTLTPSGYLATRENGRGVDVNRNFDFFWKYETSATKGPAAASEAEVGAVKAFLDANPVALVIDCHVDSTIANLSWAGGSAWSGGNQSLGWGAKVRYERAYGLSSVRYGGDAWIKGGAPTLSSWADHYLRNNLQRPSGAGVIFESNHMLLGSVSLSSTSKAGMRSYCGMIHSYILEWLEVGQQPAQVREQVAQASRGARAPSVSMSAGGSKIDSNTYTAVFFDTMPGPAGAIPHMDIPIPSPGNLFVDGSLTAENPHTAPITLQVRLVYAETPESGTPTYTPIPAAAALTTIAPSGFANLALGGRIHLPNVSGGRMQRIALEVRQYLPGAIPASPAVLYDVKTEARFYADTYASPWPAVKRTT